MEKVYSIHDLDGYLNKMRQIAASAISEQSVTDDLDEFITIKQAEQIVKTHCLGYNDNNEPMIDDDANTQIVHDAIVWIHNAGLAKLAAKDLLECFWDDNENTMVFFKKESENVKSTNTRRNSSKNN
jgi:hypothetical protein